jgi:hypothetical protein
MVHVGRTNSFVPVITDGADLWRIDGEKKFAVNGTKGLKWITRGMAISRGASNTLAVDMSYFEKLSQDAVDAITKFDESSGLDGSSVIPNTI